jgi:RNA polymerase sigma-70 factor, ECF subfamily
MNNVTSQPATAAPVTGGTPVEGFSPEMGGYSENLASQPDNDADLRSGEKAARFEREVVPLHEVLYQHALHMCRHNHADAEDLVQDTMVKAYSSFHSFLPNTNLKKWLYRIQTNTYIDGYRRKLRQPIQCSTSGISEQELVAHARRTWTGPVSAEDEALAAMPDTEIMAAMQSLPDQVRAAVYYADVEGFRYQEIADIMGTSHRAVQSRLARGRQHLRRMLADPAHAGSSGRPRVRDSARCTSIK